ncbi:MAG: hypothetical protein GX595_11675 [Lentisphaerae bacterium]|nr:hypothetical protein [Lentisphaerota bacterium]
MNRHRLSACLAACMALGVAWGADTPALRLTAYINVASGCQRPTEAFLQDLARRYAGRVALEMVDFGSPEGQKRWKADGHHCMTITLDGSSQATIVTKGVEVAVSFTMPAGHLWLHEDLETAVRQRLDGIAPADRRGPALSLRREPPPAAVLADDAVMAELPSAEAAERLLASLRQAAEARPIIQDDFALDLAAGQATVSLRGVPVLALAGSADEAAGTQAAATFERLVKPFPRVARPFAGQVPMRMRR